MGIVSFEKRNLSNFSGFSCLNDCYTDGFFVLITIYDIPVALSGWGGGMGCEFDRALPSVAEVKNKCVIVK